MAVSHAWSVCMPAGHILCRLWAFIRIHPAIGIPYTTHKDMAKDESHRQRPGAQQHLGRKRTQHVCLRSVVLFGISAVMSPLRLAANPSR